MTEEQQRQQSPEEQQRQESPVQRLERALAEIRKVQNMLEISYPSRTEAIKVQREAGDLVWQTIQETLEQQQKGS